MPINPNFLAPQGFASFAVIGNIVTLNMHDIKPINGTINSNTVITSIPEKYRPVNFIEGPSAVIGQPEFSTRWAILEDGSVQLRGSGVGSIPNTFHSFSATWGVPLNRL
ncbi:MAG: hypothetical protein ACRC54_04960 [Fusobacteriaceae bacterium]